jgi:site-specific recombinase XerD
MKCVIDGQVVLSHPPQGPIAVHVETFAKSLRVQGYARYSIYRHVLLAAGFSHWLGQQRVTVRGLTTAHVQQYLRFRTRQVQLANGDAAALRHLLEFLRNRGIVPGEKRIPRSRTSVDKYLHAYTQYLQEVRGLAPRTIDTYIPFIRQFLTTCFSNRLVVLSQLQANDVVRFVQRQAALLQPKRAKIVTCALRSFLQYARMRGAVKRDLAAAVPIVPNWSLSTIPRAIGPDQVRQLLQSIDQRTALGQRDYAILLFLARLGLRAGEIATLELDDLDWHAGQLTVRGKSGQRNELPLPPDVGKALATYLQHGRPQSGNRRVFLRAKAPIRGFHGSSGVGSIVRHRLQRIGLATPTHGTHQFRHGLATEMLRQGASLGEIGEVLGHRNPETTKIYTKVDLDALRSLAVAWPGGVR